MQQLVGGTSEFCLWFTHIKRSDCVSGYINCGGGSSLFEGIVSTGPLHMVRKPLKTLLKIVY